MSAPVLGACDPEQDVLAKVNLNGFALGVRVQKFASLSERASICPRHQRLESRRGLAVDQIDYVGFEQASVPPAWVLARLAVASLIQINSPVRNYDPVWVRRRSPPFVLRTAHCLPAHAPRRRPP